MSSIFCNFSLSKRAVEAHGLLSFDSYAQASVPGGVDCMDARRVAQKVLTAQRIPFLARLQPSTVMPQLDACT